ncbi:MAG: hypothetical protein JNG86_08395, partial [Verrucomicrobiaceae bacterium]|nr:hypothetical protein [Verrucomicrobiaceae bacterium]
MKRLAMTIRLLFASVVFGMVLSPAWSQEATRKLETLLLLPEPKAMRNALSVSPAGSKLTVLTPARETAKGIETYSPEAFQALGISVETFSKRAATAADKRLAALKPELIRDEQGRVLYAVFRGDSPLFATLLAAPSLAKVFEPMFGNEIWLALPDRHALYVFP